VFSATGRLRDSEFQGASTLAGAPVLEVDDQELDVSLDKPLETGGTFSLGFNTVNTRTNNQFAIVDPATTDAFEVAYTQPLWRGFGREYATSVQREAEAEYERQRERLRQTRQTLLSDVAQRYWELVAAQEQLEVADSSLELALEQLEQNRRRLEAGIGTEVEVIQVEAEVAQRRERTLFMLTERSQADDRLKQLLFPVTDADLWDTEIVPVTELPAEVSAERAPGWTDALLVALENRSELRQQRHAIEAAEIRRARALSERGYQLDLTLSAASQGFSGESSEAFETALEYEFPSYTAALTFSLPFGNKTAEYAERAARALVRSARLAYDQLEVQVLADVRRAVRAVVYNAQAVHAAEESLRLARRQLEAEQARYNVGQSTNFQVLEFQQQLTEALSSERRARVNYVRSLAELDFAIGTIGERSP
jgi:outer membrane protein TolC